MNEWSKNVEYHSLKILNLELKVNCRDDLSDRQLLSLNCQLNVKWRQYQNISPLHYNTHVHLKKKN